MRKLCASGLMLSPFMLILFAANLDAQNFVYVNRNRRGANSVTALSVASNGALTPVHERNRHGGRNIGTLRSGD